MPDSLDATRAVLRQAAAECDVVVTSGGVSVGDADYVKPAVEAEGPLLMWRIAMKPGRPLAFGNVGKSFFIGLPGNPVSSFVTFLIFVRPFLLKAQGMTDIDPHAIAARADFDWLEPDTRREFLRARWNRHGGLELYPTQDSAVLTSTAWADGLIDNPCRAGDPQGRHRAVPALQRALPVKVKAAFLRIAARAARRGRRRSSSCRRASTPSARCASTCARAAANGRACSRPNRPVRAAVNQDMVQPAATIKAGDEVAFFPPVTGG